MFEQPAYSTWVDSDPPERTLVVYENTAWRLDYAAEFCALADIPISALAMSEIQNPLVMGWDDE